MTSRHLACRDVVDLVTSYLEHALADIDAERFELHLAMCGWCVEYVEQMRVTPRLVGRLRDDEVDPAVLEGLLDRFRAR